MHMIKTFAALSVSALLAACGGGGGGSSTTPVTSGPKAEGVYEGTSTTFNTVNILALENDEVYALYGNTSGGTFLVSGFIWAQGTSNNGMYTSSTARDYPNTAAPTTGSLTASYVANTSFNGTATGNGVSTGFTTAPPTNSTYVYNTPAQLSTITGTWNGSSLFGESGTLVIASNGDMTASFTGNYSGTCTATGKASPRASGKNVYDVSLTFGATPCSLPGTAAKGIAVSYMLANSQRQLIAAITTADKSSGGLFFAAR